MTMRRIGSVVFILLCSFVFFSVSGPCDETGGLAVSLLLRDGSIITRAPSDPPPLPEKTDISVKDSFVKWKNLNIEGMVYTYNHLKYTVDIHQMEKEFLSIELVDSKLRPYQDGTLRIEKESGNKITVTEATLLSYMGHPDGVADILAIEFDGYNGFWRDIFIDIRDVKTIRFDKEKRIVPKAATVARKAASPRFASSSKEIVQALNRVDSFKSGDGSVNLNVLFNYNSYEIRPSSAPLLKELGKALSAKELKEKSVLIKGHTDSDGSDSFNQNLSLKRARAVRTFLVSKFGISPKKLVTAGYGETSPFVPNTSKANKQKNRRVEIRLND